MESSEKGLGNPAPGPSQGGPQGAFSQLRPPSVARENVAVRRLPR